MISSQPRQDINNRRSTRFIFLYFSVKIRKLFQPAGLTVILRMTKKRKKRTVKSIGAELFAPRTKETLSERRRRGRQ